MSLILDALRKMEQERKSRRGAGDLRPEVLRYRGEASPQQQKPYLLVAAGVVLLAAGVVAGIMVKGNPEVERAANLSPAPTAAVVTAPTAPAAATAPIAPAASMAPAAPSLPAAVPVTPPQATPTPTTAAAPAPSARVGDADAMPADALLRSKRLRKSVSDRPAAMETARKPQGRATHLESQDEVLANIPDITISGIAWQDERSLRRAVLNGALVGEGAEVAGARVVEIKETRVRLSRGGRLFDVVFSSGH